MSRNQIAVSGIVSSDSTANGATSRGRITRVSYARMKTSRQRRASDDSGGDGGGARDHLVDAAAALIAEGGPSAATSRAIADRAGENLAAITYYFGSKDALVSAALIRQARALIQPVVDALGADEPPEVRLLAAVTMLVEIVAERRHQLAAYLDCLARTAHDDRLAEEVRSLSRAMTQELAVEMTHLRERRLIPGWVDPTAMASLVVALANGVVAGVVVDPDRTDPAAIGAQFASLLLAVRTDPAA